MKFRVIKGIVKRNGAFLKKGSVFYADQSDVAELIASGFIEPDITYPAESKENPPELTGDNTPEEKGLGMTSEEVTPPDGELIEAPTVEEFANMKADQQKALLVELGIEPASNREDRIAQYRSWYDSDDALLVDDYEP